MSRRLPDTVTGLDESLVGIGLVQLLGGAWGLGVVSYKRSHPRHLTELHTRDARALAVLLLEWAQVADDRNVAPPASGAESLPAALVEQLIAFRSRVEASADT
jgi:hypothetical protein